MIIAALCPLPLRLSAFGTSPAKAVEEGAELTFCDIFHPFTGGGGSCREAQDGRGRNNAFSFHSSHYSFAPDALHLSEKGRSVEYD